MHRRNCLAERIAAFGAVAVLILVAAAAQAQFSSSSTNVNDADCRGLKLVAASGVPNGDVHEYKFQGVCKLLEVSHGSNSAFGFTTSTDSSSTTLGSAWVVAGAKWRAKTGEFGEGLQVQGKYAGTIKMSLKCASDPVITNVTCFPVAFSNTTGWDGFDHPYAVPRPITRGKTTLAEASAFSNKPQGATPPPPPPPAPKPNATATPGTVHMLSQPVPALGRASVIPLVHDARVALADGRALVAHPLGRSVVWALVGPRGETLRTFPAGASAARDATGVIVVESGGEVVRLGK